VNRSFRARQQLNNQAVSLMRERGREQREGTCIGIGIGGSGSSNTNSSGGSSSGNAAGSKTAAEQLLLRQQQAAADIGAEGVAVLRRLHAQVLPFIMRRTKDQVAQELPKKVLIDVHCPLTDQQKQLYAQFQRGLNLSDDALERQLLALPQFAGADNGGGTGTGIVAASIGETFNSDSTHGAQSMMPAPHISASVHPLQALMFLKLLCVHPGLAYVNMGYGVWCMFRGLYHFAIVGMFHYYWCIRKPWSSFVMLYNFNNNIIA